jgi:signal-transduction protein with cAMP-binding, CBS, and nucleotidyltransferase domain
MARERVRDLVTAPPVVVGRESSLRSAAQQLARAGQGAAVVGQTRRVDGVLCEHALVGAVARGLDVDATPVDAVMTPHFASLDAATPIDEAQQEVRAVDVHFVAVTAAARVVGLLSVEEVLRVPSEVSA